MTPKEYVKKVKEEQKLEEKRREQAPQPFFESKNKAYRQIGFRKINGEIAAQYGFITQKRDDFLLQIKAFFRF